MELSNNQPIQTQPKPVSTAVKIFCCIVLLICSVALSALTFYIGTEGVTPAIPVGIAAAVLVLCVTFALTLCKGKVFIGCAVAGFLLIALISPWFSVLFVALVCGAIAAAAITSDGKPISYLPAGLAAALAFGIAIVLTRDPMLALHALLPVATGFALSNGYQKQRSIILSVGIAAGLLIALNVIILGGGALLSGMQPTAQGVKEYIGAFHAAVSGIFAETLQLMTNTPELGEQLAMMLGGEITPELIKEFSDSVALAVIGMLPGIAIMLAWIVAFVANRGFTAMIMRGVDKKDFPAFLTAYEPSVPTALFTILCYLALMISSFITGGEIVVFVALNLLLAVLPMMMVCGILSIISNFKHAPAKWPLVLTYLLAFFFLGVAVVPMIAFFGAFAVITQAIARALESKFKDFKGDQ